MKVKRLNNYKSARKYLKTKKTRNTEVNLTSPSKLRKEEHRNYFANIIDRMIMNEMVLNNCKSVHSSFKTKTRETQKL